MIVIHLPSKSPEWNRWNQNYWVLQYQNHKQHILRHLVWVPCSAHAETILSLIVTELYRVTLSHLYVILKPSVIKILGFCWPGLYTFIYYCPISRSSCRYIHNHFGICRLKLLIWFQLVYIYSVSSYAFNSLQL